MSADTTHSTAGLARCARAVLTAAGIIAALVLIVGTLASVVVSAAAPFGYFEEE